MLDSSKVKEMLQQDGYFDAVKLIELLEGGVNRRAEYLYLKAFARESDFKEDACREQFRCLWTAYCLHHGLTVDTSGYDNDVLELWNTVYPACRNWDSFDDFDAFMCWRLV